MEDKLKYRIRVTYNNFTERYLFVESEEELTFTNFRISDHLPGPASDNVIALAIMEDRYQRVDQI